MNVLRFRIVALLSTLFLIALWPANSVLSQEPELVARWPLDETSGEVVHDVVGGHDGIFVGGDLEWVAGKFENGLNFGGNGNVEIPKDAKLEPADSLTVTAWVKFNSLAEEELVAYADSYFLRLKGGVFCAYIHLGGWPQAVGQTQVETGKWYFAAMTYDGLEVKIYVDGVLDGTKAAPGAIDYLDLAFRFGLHSAGGSRWLDGILDEVGIWNKAMTAEEVMSAFTSPPSTAVSPEGRLTTEWGRLKLN